MASSVAEDKTVTQPAVPEPDFTERLIGAICIGMRVHWYQSGDRGPTKRFADIKKVFKRQVTLAIWSETGGEVWKHVTGVKHINDPTLSANDKASAGAFELFTQDHRLIVDVLKMTAPKVPPPKVENAPPPKS